MAFLFSSAATGVLIAQPALAQALSVTISSPASSATFNRGEAVTISASVTSGGSPVSGASVTANSPTGGTITLAQTSTAGVYSGGYQVLPTDPAAPWTINVQAVSQGQVASAHVAVTISDSLVVSLLSPASGSVFNIGETTTVKVTVTYQDTTPVSASATVSFTNPRGTAFVMTVDSSDPSGKTWTGVYTIVASDIPAPGFTWPITVTASVVGNTGSAARNVNLFNTLEVSASTFSSSAYTTPRDTFAIGQTVFVKAVATLHDGTLVSSGTLSFTITGTSAATTPAPMAFSSSLGVWTGFYTLLSSDQLGSQTISVSAADTQGNTGSGSHQITIQAAPAFSVLITSPPPNSIFNRGETVTISASVMIGGSPATSAMVTANTPSGASIAFTNAGGGVYSIPYTILSTDPVGTWVITVHASQGGQSASSQVVETVSNSLHVAVSTWSSSFFTTPQDSFNIGQTIFVKAQVSLQDGTLAPTGTTTVNFLISGTSVAASPVAMTFSSTVNAWIGSYTLLQTDQAGTQVVTVMASNAAGNTGSGTHSIGAQVPSPTTMQSLEAAVTFNTSTQDLQVNAVCNPGCVGPTTVTLTSTVTTSHGEGHGEGHGRAGGETVRVYAVSDLAGHTLTLTLRVRHHGHQLKAQIISIQYGNSAPVKLSHNTLAFHYSLDKDGNIKTLEQKVRADGTSGNAHFNAKKGTTTITIHSEDSQEGEDDGTTSLTRSGLWLLEMTTSNGALNINFFQSQ